MIVVVRIWGGGGGGAGFGSGCGGQDYQAVGWGLVWLVHLEGWELCVGGAVRRGWSLVRGRGRSRRATGCKAV